MNKRPKGESSRAGRKTKSPINPTSSIRHIRAEKRTVGKNSLNRNGATSYPQIRVESIIDLPQW